MSPANTLSPGAGASPNSDSKSAVKAKREAEKERQKAEKAKRLAEKEARKKQVVVPKPPSTKRQHWSRAALNGPLPEYVEETPKREKKILKPFDNPFNDAYIPKVVESAWNDWWEAEGFFQPQFDGVDQKPKPAGTYVIPIPPPNVTGALHCGHALGTALQDCLVRWHRMRGFTTLYLPGCDHASISTQSVIENMLWRREKKTRHDLGREQFLHRALEWKEEYHSKITNVLKRLGGSFDWTREAFTMDENLSTAVAECFVRFHEEGYIYRSSRLVNWCVHFNTAISNLEVDTKELKGRTLLDVPGYERPVEFGVLVYFRYQVQGSEETIEIATTRPETIMGDTAVAVHPDDARYKHLIGRKIQHPFVGHLLTIIADDYVDPGYGTGAVKITPAHDANDYEIGKRHNLPFISILNDDGTLNANGGKYAGQRRFDVRYAVVEDLKELGLFVKKESNPMKVPLCVKSKDVIEPLMKPQWWMRTRELADEAMRVVRDGEIKIQPDVARINYFRWLENINDWCLSRQLWWGHQIPAYLVDLEGRSSDETENTLWVAGRTEEEARKKAESKYPGQAFTLRRDPDVLDTWFSAGLWPFSTLGWPRQTHDLEHLFPTSLLETGWDILFFWVARMIMLSLKLTGKVPFKEVYCHSLIRDSEGRKMSKSLGNVIDPVDVMEGIELQQLHDKLLLGNLDPRELKVATKYQKSAFAEGIPECGADALRFSLIQYTTGGPSDISFDVKVISGYRRFCNKIYQAAKFVVKNIGDEFTPSRALTRTGDESLAERWMLHKLNTATQNVNHALSEKEFSRAAQIVYQYWWDHLCQVFIEHSKFFIQNGSDKERASVRNTLYNALDGGLRMAHPFTPFISEELWQRLPRRPDDSTPSIVIAPYPEYSEALIDDAAEAEYETVTKCVKGIRSLMAGYGVQDDAKVYIHADDSQAYTLIQQESGSIKSLSGKALGSLHVLEPTDNPPAGCAVHVSSASTSVFLEINGRIDTSEAVDKAKKQLEKISEALSRQRRTIDGEGWAERVDANVKAVELRKLSDLEAEYKNVVATIEQLGIS
ncbi:valyl-tRNA synthetase [Aspergillus heteromorphus CBS 117.55]|uniref:Valine--tRNA ligase, mitochondrial n=1 Tax=Aspergillus heteromorphus CBS 117.55 TaxID=1448321 RepID=A0A317WTV9_9EURO|nr:valyl-tRNA synthetase [Aspergillus heteromorphus CBS 117.55]PWY89853.1 valyl-tRNA synthetase [Aspergillus heteromorphus CBS 117.55]